MSDPYQIENAPELDAVRFHLWEGAYFMLVADIDLSGYNWLPIGDSSTIFQGNIDGNGFKITNLSINRPGVILLTPHMESVTMLIRKETDSEQPL
jgi:hypothetical protein